MSKRPTIRDLAHAAGVSVATVDRVLNARTPVRGKTAQRVYDAAVALDYPAVSLLRTRVPQELPGCRLGVLFQTRDRVFYQMVCQCMEEAAAAYPQARIQLQFEHAPGASTDVVVEKLYALGEHNQAIAVVAPDYPLLTTAIAELKARGVAVFSLLSDVGLGVRAGYVGVENRKVGRTAAWFIASAARAACGKVACFVGSHRYRGHESREIGLRSYFRECAPQFEVLDVVVNLELPDVTFETTLHLLRTHCDLAGIYIGGGGGAGAITALKEAGAARQLPLVVSELLPFQKVALAEGSVWLVIATRLPELAQACIQMMTTWVLAEQKPPPVDVFIPFELCGPENI